MRNEFALAFNEVLEDKGLPRDVILKALESAMVSAYRRSVNASSAQRVESKVDTETGKWTALNLLLTLAGIEILVVHVKKLNRQVNPIDFLFKLKRRKEENST